MSNLNRTFHTGSMHNVTVTVSVLPGITLVAVRKSPGVPFSRVPAASVLRNMVDATLAGTGRKRVGARYGSGNKFSYPTT